MANLFMRFPGGRAKALTLSYDDGVEQDAQLIKIMTGHGLKGTFNLNSGLYAEEGTIYPAGTIHRRMTKSAATQLYKNAGMEVAVHGLTHPFFEQLPLAACNYEISEDRRNLEQQFNTIVRGAAYPFGTYNDNVVDILRMNGIVYSRTVNSTNNFYIPHDWLRLNPTCHHRDARLPELTEKFISEKPGSSPMLFYLWGHTYEFDEHDEWKLIENFAERTGGRDDIWYATNIEIYDYINAYKQLLFSSNMCRVKNPSAFELFFEYNGKPYSIAPGASMVL